MTVRTMTYSLNRIAGTSGFPAQKAANLIAGTEGKSLQGALNAMCGTSGWGYVKCLNILAGTSGLDEDRAADVWADRVALGSVTYDEAGLGYNSSKHQYNGWTNDLDPTGVGWQYDEAGQVYDASRGYTGV